MWMLHSFYSISPYISLMTKIWIELLLIWLNLFDLVPLCPQLNIVERLRHKPRKYFARVWTKKMTTFYSPPLAHHVLPVLVFPDAEPFDQILGALQFGVKTIFLPLEPGHILHRHTDTKTTGHDEEKLSKGVNTVTASCTFLNCVTRTTTSTWDHNNNSKIIKLLFHYFNKNCKKDTIK